jgi:predicted dehydrogenase
VAARYGVPHTYASHQEMLEKERLDAIVASQPFTRHGVLVPELLRARKPIFTEKPLAASVEVGERILRELDACGSWQMVGYHKRSDPATMYAKEEIDRLRSTGELGKMRYVRITMPPGDWIAGGFSQNIWTDDAAPELEWDPPPADLDENARTKFTSFVNYYIHQVNLMRHLMGEPYRVSYADPAQVVLVAHGESGVTGVIETAPYETSRDWHETALVCFERGFVRLDLPAPLVAHLPGRVTLFRDPGDKAVPTTTVPVLEPVHAMRQQAVNFIRAVRGEIPPLCSAAEALEDLKVARQYLDLLLTAQRR